MLIARLNGVVVAKFMQKEAAALKIKATASKARENLSAIRRLFFFTVVRQIIYHYVVD